MSRTKTETVDVESAENEAVSENIEVSETVEEAETVKNPVETISETVAEKESETTISRKNVSEMPVKISVIQYLENKPQSVYVAELMKKNYGMEFHSENEWDLLLQKLIGKKI
nr:MAG TPA: hypothetical protein [Bacteriophage sp.]